MPHQHTTSKILLDSITEHIVSTASPRRNILFGSAAKNHMRIDSDIENHHAMKNGKDIYHAAPDSLLGKDLRGQQK